MKPDYKYVIGIDEAGETVGETVARGYLGFLELAKEIVTTGTVPVRKGPTR